MADRTWKDGEHHWSLGKCKLKPQDAGLCTLEWLKSKGEMVSIG